MVGRGSERNQTSERPLRVFDNPVQAAEYRFVHTLLNKPQIKALQLKGGTDISLFKGLPNNDVYWVEDDPKRAGLVRSNLSSGEQARILPGPSRSYRHDSPVDLLALRSAHLDGGEEQELYRNVDANIRPGGYLITSHHRHQRDAAHFVADPAYELVGILTNIGTQDDPRIEFVPEHNEEYIERLKLFAKRNDDPTKDEYSGTTFLFKKKEPVISPPQPIAAPPLPSEPHHRETPPPPVPAQQEPEPVQPTPQQPVTTTVHTEPKAQPKVESKKEEPKKKETFKTVTETSRKWMKSKLQSIQKVLADLGMTVAGEVWTTLASLISVGTISLYFITGGAFTPIAPLVGAVIPSAIGALVNYPGIKGSKSDGEKVAWWGSHIAASAGILSPVSNVLSAVTKFLGRAKNVAH